MKHFVVYDIATGNVLRTGTCPPEMVQLQAGAGEGVIEASPGVVAVAEVNLEPVRQQTYGKIDDQAEAVRAKFITIGSGQAMTYHRKETEARAFDAATDPVATDYPFLNAEATATGIAIADVAAAVLAQTNAWVVIGAKIEGARMAAKKAVAAAADIPAMVAAATIDWDTVLA